MCARAFEHWARVKRRKRHHWHRQDASRRGFLAAGGGLAGALALGPFLGACSNSRKGAPESIESRAPSRPHPPTEPGRPPPEPPEPLEDTVPTAGAGSEFVDTPTPNSTTPNSTTPNSTTPRQDTPDEPLCGAGGELVVDTSTTFFVPQKNPVGNYPPPDGWFNAEHYPLAAHSAECEALGRPWSRCLELEDYVELVHGGSDTSIAVVGGLPYVVGDSGEHAGGWTRGTQEELFEGAEQIESRYPGRVLRAVPVMCNDRLQLQLERMGRLAAVAHAWNAYPTWSTMGGAGYRLDDEIGQAMIRRGLELERPIFIVRKTPMFFGGPPEVPSATDVGPAGRMFPEAHIVIQGAAFEAGMEPGSSSAPDPDPTADKGWGPGLGMFPEGPYDELDQAVQALYPLSRGVNGLIKSLRDHDIGPNGRDLDDPQGPVTTRIYAECSTAWPALAAPGREQEAMHFWGKLLKHVGEDRILWGTGAILYGGPQPYIEAFRKLEISEQLQEEHGYPPLSALRKEKILGLNAARLFNTLPDVSITGCHADQLSGAGD